MRDTTHVDDQEKICRKLLPKDAVLKPDKVFKDNSKSAWRHDRVRPDWDAMLEAIRAGQIQILAVYHGDRLARQPRDLEDLIDLGKACGLILISPTGRYDLSDPDHQMMLRWMVARAKNEVDHMSRRMKDGRRRSREQGIERVAGRGGRVFGFETDSVTHVPGEVTLICEAADRVLASESTGGILRDWVDRGVKTTAGGTWSYRSFKRMLLRPRYAGLLSDGETPAAWEPVYDGDRDKAREVWESVCAVLSGKVLPLTPSNRARYLLSGIAVCGSCRQTVVVRHQQQRQNTHCYSCQNSGCPKQAHRRMAYVDAYVIGHVLELLNDEEFIASLYAPGDPGLSREIAMLEARKAEAEHQLARLVDNPHVKPELLAESIAGFDERIGEVRERIAMSSSHRLLSDHAGIGREAWERLPLPSRRALVAASYRVTILPTGRRGPGFDPDSVQLDLIEE